MDNEWRVEVELGDEGHGLSIGERLRTLDLDDEARAAEEVVRKLAAEDRIEAETSLTRWDAEAEAWVGPGGAGAAAATETEGAGEAEWEARIVLPSVRKAFEVARRLRDEGLEVRRRWRFVLALAASEEHATELASRLRAEVPDAEQIDVERATGVIHPVFVMLGAAEPGAARDLGL
jgi:hypothetical protein